MPFSPADIVEALAEHRDGAIGGMLPIRELTKITVAGRFISQEAGHMADGTVLTIGGKAYRLNVAGVAQARKAA
jgi:hypothetical protein